MNQWMMLPLLLPVVAAALIVITARFDLVLARVFCLGAACLTLIVDIILLSMAGQGGAWRYELGDWSPAIGISLLLDRLSGLMLVLSGVVGVLMALAAMEGKDDRGRHFHALLLLQLMGVHGAFLTHDLFNLFVYFEVMLGASYGLMVYGGGPRRLQAGIQFVAINLFASTLFLIAVGLIYSVTGVLDMTQLRIRWSMMAEGDQAIANTGLVLLFAVFALKAAVVPFHFWMPSAYANTSPIVAGLFALSTKVGVYALIRVQAILMAGQESLFSEWVTAWILPASLITVVLGMVGVLGSRTLGQLASYASLASGGTIVIAVSRFEPAATVAALYYLIHSTLAGALIFLVVAAIASLRPQAGDRLRVVAPVPFAGLVGGLFLIAAVSLVGLPPLSGFIGKLIIISAVLKPEGPQSAGIWILATLLATSLLGIMGFARAGSTLFWKPSGLTRPQISEADPSRLGNLESSVRACPFILTAAGLIAVGLIGLAVGAGPVYLFLEQLVWQLGITPGGAP